MALPGISLFFFFKILGDPKPQGLNTSWYITLYINVIHLTIVDRTNRNSNTN